jgi:hypothetical protein
MATDKKHIAVYLDPAVEAALVTFCQQKGLKSKKGTMFSAGVNAVLAEFFGITNTEVSNIPPTTDNIPAENSNTLFKVGHIPVALISNIPAETIAVEVLPGKLRA